MIVEGGYKAIAGMGQELTEGYYRRLGDGSDMSVDSNGGSVAMSMSLSAMDSSVGSNNSRSNMLMLDGVAMAMAMRTRTRSHVPATGGCAGAGVGHSVAGGGAGADGAGTPAVGAAAGGAMEDALAAALMDERFATEGLQDYDEWTIDLRRLSMGPAFAQGAFGKLYRGTYNGEEVAVKILERPENNAERAAALEQQFRQEVRMLATLRHQNVVRFIGACRKPLVWCIVTEYAKGGSVRQALARRHNRPVPLKVAVKQALDVARGMEYLQSLGFIHRDLKSDNLLIATDKSIKIADFGVARIEVQTEGMTPETGTYRWMAPEMIQHRAYNSKVDVYSFGIVLWELITGMLPFQNMTAVQAAFAVVNKGVRPAIPPDCPPALSEIMSRCWDANPDVRPSFSEVVRMLEDAQVEIMTTVRKARFRCCMTLPLTAD